MMLTVEISMYPLAETHVPPIEDFIDKLNSYEGLRVETFPTSTVVVGESVRVMTVLGEAMSWSHQQHGKAVFVSKFIHDYAAL